MRIRRQWLGTLSIVLVLVFCLSCGDDEPSGPGENTAPVASFTVSPALGGTETVFEFDASGSSDAEDAVTLLEVRWDWENDGWDTDWSTTNTANHQYDKQGPKTAKLEVRDTGGVTDDTTRAVAVSGANVPPMVPVPAGTFEMGDGVAFGGTDQHQVTLTRGFYLSMSEATTRQYRDALQWAYDQDPKLVTCEGGVVRDAVDGSTVMLVALGPSYSRIYYISDGDSFAVESGYEDHPVTNVTWYGAAVYCNWLSLQAGLSEAYNHSTWECNNGDPYTAAGYRLPTDAEWEYATQYSGERLYPWGDDSPDCSRANYDCGAGWVGGTTPVGSYPGWTVVDGDPVYDMAGNVMEWCNNWWESISVDPEDPRGPSSGSYRVVRGGSWSGGSAVLLCADRSGVGFPSYFGGRVGFRCARSQ